MSIFFHFDQLGAGGIFPSGRYLVEDLPIFVAKNKLFLDLSAFPGFAEFVVFVFDSWKHTAAISKDCEYKSLILFKRLRKDVSCNIRRTYD